MNVVLSTPIHEAEDALLACIINTKTGMMSASNAGITSSDFSNDQAQIIFEHCVRLSESDRSIDSITLSSELESGGKLDLIGGQGVVERLLHVHHDPDLVSEYAGIIKDRSIRRSLRDVAERIVTEIEVEPEIKNVIETTENLVFNIGDSLDSFSHRGVSSSELIQIYNTSRKDTERIPYPIGALNTECVGRTRGSLSIWAGYSSDGKSIMGMQSAVSACMLGYSVGYFSLEMTEEELLYRLLSMLTGIDSQRIELGDIDLEEQGTVNNALLEVADWNLKIYADPGITPGEIRSRQMREKFDLIVIDYLQRFPFNDWQEIARMTKSFKNLALSSKCCVDLLSQVNVPEYRPGKNPYPLPTMNSLFGGKALTHEANNIIFIHASRDQETNWGKNGFGQIVLAKARGGRSGVSVPVRFDAKRVMWSEL